MDATNKAALQDLVPTIDESEPFNIQLRYLVVSKIDISQKVTDEEISVFCKKHQLRWYKCSSLTGENVE